MERLPGDKSGGMRSRVGNQVTFSLAQNGGLYLHIPFCVKKCPYCDFYSITDRTLLPRFMEALSAEIRMRAPGDVRFDTIYIGGGTPSLLGGEHVAGLIGLLSECYDVAAGCEVTLEVNPGTVDFKRLVRLREAGVNRLSIGVQSFRTAHLEFLGRIHSGRQAERTITDAGKAGFDNVGIDLIYGLPEQDLPSWKADLQRAVDFGPAHFSCYMLTLESGTPLERDCRAGRFQPLPEKDICELYETTVAFLGAEGYAQYEVSNFAASPALRSRHNTKYWTFAPYLGFGPAAHSYAGSGRSWNHASLDNYVKALQEGVLPVAGCEELSLEQQWVEFLYLGFRQNDGIDIEEADSRFGGSFADDHAASLAAAGAEGLLMLEGGRCRLTVKGMLCLDSVVPLFIDDHIPYEPK